MTVVELRTVLLAERLKGKRPAVVVLDLHDFADLMSDLTIRMEVFDPVIIHGVQVVTDTQVLDLSRQSRQTQPAGPQ